MEQTQQLLNAGLETSKTYLVKLTDKLKQLSSGSRSDSVSVPGTSPDSARLALHQQTTAMVEETGKINQALHTSPELRATVEVLVQYALSSGLDETEALVTVGNVLLQAQRKPSFQPANAVIVTEGVAALARACLSNASCASIISVALVAIQTTILTTPIEEREPLILITPDKEPAEDITIETFPDASVPGSEHYIDSSIPGFEPTLDQKDLDTPGFSTYDGFKDFIFFKELDDDLKDFQWNVKDPKDAEKVFRHVDNRIGKLYKDPEQKLGNKSLWWSKDTAEHGGSISFLSRKEIVLYG